MTKLKNGGRAVTWVMWMLVTFFLLNGGVLENFFNSTEAEVKLDTKMQTEAYNTDIEVGTDGSYQVNENIAVSFLEYRHGIYRYIPNKGTVISYDENGKEEKIPYYAKVKLIDSNYTTEVSSENGNKVLKFGDEDRTVLQGKYDFTYRFTPSFQQEAYENVYYNVFPAQWQNTIPTGSTFSIRFPKEFDFERLKFYYGAYGEAESTEKIMELTREPGTNIVRGRLKEDLAIGKGITCFAAMDAGYFTKTHQVNQIPWLILIPSLFTFASVLLLFFLFGRDEAIIPSIQYQLPEGLDSAAVGYIIDGKVDDKDLLSLIIYWADKGYLRIEEIIENKLKLYRLSELPEQSPNYQMKIFQKLFEKGDSVKIDDLKYQFTKTLTDAKSEMKNWFIKTKRNRIYTINSIFARGISLVLTMVPLGIFMFVTSCYTYTSTFRNILQIALWLCVGIGMRFFSTAIDKWYSRTNKNRVSWVIGAAGLVFISAAAYIGSYFVRVIQRETFNYIWILVVVVVITAVMVVLTGFMKKRNHECVEWMGKLSGLRDFIETAELDRLKVLAQDNPFMFYHIIPYAYVFGLSDVFAKKLQGIALPAPQWYRTEREFSVFDYYIFNRCLIGNMSHVAETLSVPKPSSTQSGTGGSSSGGGGSSGGGFGGGGGGSW